MRTFECSTGKVAYHSTSRSACATLTSAACLSSAESAFNFASNGSTAGCENAAEAKQIKTKAASRKNALLAFIKFLLEENVCTRNPLTLFSPNLGEESAVLHLG